MQPDIEWAINKLAWMEEHAIWPNGLRYLWTDAFGVILLVSLSQALNQPKYLERAEWVVKQVERALGRKRGIRIGEAPDRDGQYYHYLAMWLYALYCLGEMKTSYLDKAVQLVREIHPRFVKPGMGVYWKMDETLSGPYPGYGWGALDPFHGYVVYNLLAPNVLAAEINELKELVDMHYPTLNITQDLGLGMMLWFTHFFPNQTWAKTQALRSLDTLERLWIDPPGYFCRQPGLVDTKFAFTNYGISVGLQAVDAKAERVDKLNAFFKDYQSGDRYDLDAITHVMACCSHFPGMLILDGSKD